MRWFTNLVLALALGVVGCSEASGSGGTRTDGGSGGAAGVGGEGGTVDARWEHESFVDDFVAERTLPGGPGIAFSVMGPDGVVFEKAYGMANIEESIPIDLDTPFELASVSKQFVAFAVMLLYEDGEIALDDSISEVFPEGPLSWSDITVHHLLTHQSGIAALSLEDRVGLTNDDILQWAIQQPLSFTPGDRYEYSNVGYTLLASMIERVAAQSLQSFMDERIFNPLGMQDSGIDGFPPNIPRRAVSYRILIPFEEPIPSIGAGSAYSTINDLQRWEEELRNATLMSPETLDLVFQKHVETIEYVPGTPSYYGYGWIMLQFGDWPASQEHSGSRFGFRNQVIRFPDAGLAVHMLSNGNFGWAQDFIFEELVDLCLESELSAETKSSQRTERSDHATRRAATLEGERKVAH